MSSLVMILKLTCSCVGHLTQLALIFALLLDVLSVDLSFHAMASIIVPLQVELG